ncbi:uncharacterized protein LOC113511430 [Galleria mellonella]|uniref:Uncharacterized protein LOC113511430 n=1 Tax=Galleria mellonella TaxID=7137 RepID=A0A6J1WID5_GALME|nr:uncharacterized protein LOC113511430 [Galleria mellonella]
MEESNLLRKMKQSSDLNCSSDDNSLSENLKEALKSIIRREGYVTYKIDVATIPQNGGSYLSTTTEIEVRGKTAERDKEMNIFVKNILPGDNLDFFSVSDIHSRELFVYKELSEVFTKLQDDAGVPINERYRIVKCYEETNSEFLILENLSKKGFMTIDSIDPISLSFARLSIQQLARLHALSFVLKNKRPQYFENKIKPIESPIKFNDAFKGFVTNFSRISMQSLDDDMKKKVEKFIPKVIEKMPQYLQDKSIGCLCHGDFKSTNILTKITDGEVSEVVTVDYQMIYHGNPLMDMMFFIFTGTDQQFRRNHLEEIKQLYHDTLRHFLKYFNMDVEDYFSKAKYEEMFKSCLEYGFMIALCFSPLNFAAKDDIPDFSKVSPSVSRFNIDGRLKNRLEGIVEDFTQWGYL